MHTVLLFGPHRLSKPYHVLLKTRRLRCCPACQPKPSHDGPLFSFRTESQDAPIRALVFHDPVIIWKCSGTRLLVRTHWASPSSVNGCAMEVHVLDGKGSMRAQESPTAIHGSWGALSRILLPAALIHGLACAMFFIRRAALAHCFCAGGHRREILIRARSAMVIQRTSVNQSNLRWWRLPWSSSASRVRAAIPFHGKEKGFGIGSRDRRGLDNGHL